MSQIKVIARSCVVEDMFRLLSVLCLTIVVSACGSGSSSGSSSGLGSGQDPDPVVVDFPVAYVKRPLLTDDDGNLLTSEVRRATDFFPGAQLIIRDRASPSAAEFVLTEGVFPDDEDGNPPLYDVKDLAVSFAGDQLAFAMRAPEDPDLDDDEQPTWNIWRFELETQTLSRVISSDIVAEDGHDVAPAFLPDGRIVFSSTRQRLAKAILLDEGKPQFSALDEDRDEPALTLHVMDPDGTDLQQITYNASSDLDPSVMSDGRVVYARWDNVAGRDRISLYRANPDGTEHELLYGVHSHDTGPNGEAIEFVEPTELPDGRLMVMMRPPGTQSRMGALPVAIDVNNYIEHDQPTFASSGLLADAQEILIPGDLSLDETVPPRQGRYAHISPLFDGTNRLIVSWSQCRLLDTTSDPLDPVIVPCTDENLADPNMVEADPLYGIWMNDIEEGTQQPIVVGETNVAMSEVVVMENRVSPPVILDKTAGIDLDPDLVSEAVGVLHIRSVYDFDGTAAVDIDTLSNPLLSNADDRPARFIRIVKSVSIPDDDIVDLDGTAFGRSQAQLMRDIIGYAPVEPDGSVKVRVPANIAFWLDVLDANGRRITPRHNNWMQLRPGEEMTCNGCHTTDSELPHGRRDAEAPSINAGAVVDGSPFPNTEPALFANAGETMAEVITRINGIPEPLVDLRFDDLWTDENVRPKDASFAYNYSDLSTTPPVDPGCVTNWNAACRISIHYPDHIHPIWSVNRQTLDVDGITVLADDTCTSCHNVVDAANMPMVPAAQLDLSDGPSPDEADHLKSYRELLFNDNEQEVVDGALQDVLVQATDGNGNLLFETDADGNLILDVDGNPIPVLVPVNTTPSLNVGGAAISPRFFSLFAPGGSHAGRLTDAELKIVSEWIDIGGQYYNDPFVVPQ
jgi:hydrazine synthase alpha subunit-like protein/WD40 repeat protein